MQQGARFGKYELVDQLGKGGMGEVWRARHQMLKRQAAVKLIRPDALGPDIGGATAAQILKRFEREAQATSGLRSPHTIELYDFGLSDDGTFYYAMELLEGLSLHSLVHAHGPANPERAVFILGQACESLEEAHHAGLVHRDIKPANIYLCRLGLQYDYVKVLDFGLVKREPTSEMEQTALTTQGIAPGSPAFMAPEMAKGPDKIDPRVDIYALGCVAYWLLTGSLVFERESAIEMVVAHVKDAPEAPSTRTEIEIPKALDALILACLQKDPGARPQTAKELRQRLATTVESRWSSDHAEVWWQNHKPALTTEAMDSTVRPDVVALAKSKVSRSPEEAESSDGEVLPGGKEPESREGRGAQQALAPGSGQTQPPANAAAPAAGARPAPAAPRPVPIDTEAAMSPLEKTDPMDIKRGHIRSVLQHNFTQSRIDLDELERRLGVLRVATDERELDQAVKDLQPLPEPTPIPIIETRRKPGLPVRLRRTRNVVTIFGGTQRKGRWAPGSQMKVVNVFGGAELDFRYAIWEHPEVELRCVCVFGGCEIIVPPDIYVEVDGVGVFGGFEHSGSSLGEPTEGTPFLRITGAAVFGGVEVKVKRRKKPGEPTGIELVGQAIKKLVSGDH